MSEEIDCQKERMSQYRLLLQKLPGIYAANVLPDEKGAIREIHMIANSGRNPKQICRDVQSALLAAFDLAVDYRVISIAQIGENPFEGDAAEPSAQGEFRLHCLGVQSGVEEDTYHISVHLRRGDRDFVGESSCRNTPAQRAQAVALATLEGVQAFLEEKGVFTLVATQNALAGGVAVCITVLEYMDAKGERLLIGAAQQTDDMAIGYVKSTLDALNRCFARAVRANALP
ncbi:MAG: hypothetical protein PHI98_04445 [Eubacteriales bacterium]|nr:hypothetical protein [Eubacteriales bacterium]